MSQGKTVLARLNAGDKEHYSELYLMNGGYINNSSTRLFYVLIGRYTIVECVEGYKYKKRRDGLDDELM